MEYIADVLHSTFRYFKGKHLLITIPGSILLLLGLLFTPGVSKQHAKESLDINNTITRPATTATLTPTKWWIKKTGTPLAPVLRQPTRTAATNLLRTNCSDQSSFRLRSNLYAYVSVNPPLPNRVHSMASLSSNYLGQIDPGKGLKLLDGPICADGYSWWLVQSNETGLSGWTVEGMQSEQWILACPNPRLACSKTVTPTSTLIPTSNQRSQEINQADCISEKFTIGMLVQVEQDNLLILRAEPYTGEVTGRAGPLSVAKVIAGPICATNAAWWKLDVFDLNLIGWATENGLIACPKDSECNL